MPVSVDFGNSNSRSLTSFSNFYLSSKVTEINLSILSLFGLGYDLNIVNIIMELLKEVPVRK